MNRSSIRALGVACCFLAQAVQGAEAPKDAELLGYVHGSPDKINFEVYTHLCHAFVVAEKDGSLICSANSATTFIILGCQFATADSIEQKTHRTSPGPPLRNRHSTQTDAGPPVKS